MRIFIVLLLIFINPAFAKDVYFSELVKSPGFKESWSKLVSGHTFGPYDKWIPRLSGLRSAVKFVNIDGQDLIKDRSCEPHNCQDNSISILADPKTYDIWMAQRTIAFPSRKVGYNFFGNPDDKIRKALLSNFD